MSARIRDRVARLLDRSPRWCWGDLYGWAHWRSPERLSDCRVDSTCRNDQARTGACWCGKLRDERRHRADLERQVEEARRRITNLRDTIAGACPMWAMEWPAVRKLDGFADREKFTADDVRREVNPILDAAAEVVAFLAADLDDYLWPVRDEHAGDAK